MAKAGKYIHGQEVAILKANLSGLAGSANAARLEKIDARKDLSLAETCDGTPIGSVHLLDVCSQAPGRSRDGRL